MKTYRTVVLVAVAGAAMIAGAKMFNFTAPLSLVVDRAYHEFSPTDREMTTTFRLSNRSRKATTVRSVTTSCGCTKAAVGSTTLDPGQETLLTVSTTRPPAGKMDTSITLETDVTEQPQLVFHVVVAAVSDQPRITSVEPVAMRLIDDKCPERTLRVVTIESNANFEERLRLDCDIDGIGTEQLAEMSKSLPDPNYVQVERTFRIFITDDGSRGSQLGTIRMRYGTDSTAPTLRSISLEVLGK